MDTANKRDRQLHRGTVLSQLGKRPRTHGPRREGARRRPEAAERRHDRPFLPSDKTAPSANRRLALSVLLTTRDERLVELPFNADGTPAEISESTLPDSLRRPHPDPELAHRCILTGEGTARLRRALPWQFLGAADAVEDGALRRRLTATVAVAVVGSAGHAARCCGLRWRLRQ